MTRKGFVDTPASRKERDDLILVTNDPSKAPLSDAKAILGILKATTRQIRLRGHSLDPEEIIAIVKELQGRRGVEEISLCESGVTDGGLAALLAAHAKRENGLRTLRLDDNQIELRESFDSIITSLNLSHLTELSMLSNPKPSETGIISFFANLTSPHLVELSLTICPTSDAVVSAITGYLGSPRSRNLRKLRLQCPKPDPLDPVGPPFFPLSVVRRFTAAIESRNSSLATLELLDREGRRGESSADAAAVEAEHKRLAACLKRNKGEAAGPKSSLVCDTARQYLAAAYILLNARALPPPPPPPPGIARPLPPLPAQAPRKRTRHTTKVVEAGPAETGHFRLLDLPAEVIARILQFRSGNPAALSPAQTARLHREAGIDGLREMMRAETGNRGRKNFRPEYLRCLGVDRVDSGVAAGNAERGGRGGGRGRRGV